MRLFKPREKYVEIEPNTLPVDADAAREQKIRSAIAKLGDKWVLADTRREQIAKLREDGEDLV